MASLEQFIVPQGWAIDEWVADPALGLRTDAFMKQGRLLIGKVTAHPVEQPLCSLAWLNAETHLCTIAAIPYDPVEGCLAGVVLVQSSAGGANAFCSLRLDLKSEVLEGGNVVRRLEGHFRHPGKPIGSTGGPGTLAAQADAGPVGDPDPYGDKAMEI